MHSLRLFCPCHHHFQVLLSQYGSVFARDVAENPRSGLRNGKVFNGNSIEAFLLEEVGSEVYAFHVCHVSDSEEPVPVDDLINNYLAQISEDCDPQTIEQARAIPAFAKAADDEIKMIKDFETFTLVSRDSVPPSVTTHRPIWCFRYKSDGRAKARLCFPGHCQEYGVNFTHTQSPTLHLTSFRVFLSYAHLRNAVVRHVDIKNAYLHAIVDEEVYMEQPPGYVDSEFPNHVCRMNRALYGLKQAGRLWNKLADSILISAGLTANAYDPCVYMDAIDSEDWIVVLIFVDDFLVTGSRRRVDKIIEYLASRLTISSNDEISRYIGISIRRNGDGDYLLSQTDDIKACIKKYGMLGARAVNSPCDVGLIHSEGIAEVAVSQPEYRSLIGALLYFAMCTRPDILNATVICAQFQRAPSARAWTAAKKILRYLGGTAALALRIAPTSKDLHVFSDASHGDPSVDRFSMSGLAIFFGGTLIHWASRKQKTPAHSSTEAELVAASAAARDALWIARLTEPIGTIFPVKLFVDNKSAILVANTEGLLRRVKHLEIQDVYVRVLRARGLITVEFVPGESNWSDLLTKAIKSTDQYKILREVVMHGLRGRDKF